MEVTHFEICEDHDQFELVFHCVDANGRKHAVRAPDGRSPSIAALGNRCVLNGEFRHLQRNARP